MRYPSLTIYTDKLPTDVGGCTNGPVVRIRTKYRNDAGIHAHEYEHVWQWWMGVLIGVLAALALITLPVPANRSEWWADRRRCATPARLPAAAALRN